MEANGADPRGAAIQQALEDLKQKKGSVDQVVDYCEASYLEPGANKRETFLRTEEYLKDALGSVVIDIEDMAINLMAFVDAQADAVDKVTSDVLVAKTRLLRAREQSAATRLLSLRKVAQETPARQKIVVLTGAERPKKCRPLAPRPKISLQEKLAGIYADEPTPLPLKLESAALAEDASVEDIRSAEGSIEFWGEHSPLRQGASDFNSSSANGALDSPTPRGRGISASSADTSLGTKGSFRENRGGGMKKGRSDAAGSSQSSAIAPVAAPVMAPPPPARDPVVAKRRSLKGIRPVGSSVSAPPPLVSRAKPGAPPPLLSQASRAPAGASVKPPPPPPPSLSHGSNLYGGGDSRSLPPPPPPMAPNPHDAEGGMNPPPPPLPRPPPPAVSGSVPQFTPPPPPPPSKPASAPAPQPPLPPPRTSQSQVAPPPPPPPPPPLPPVPSSQPQPPSFQLLPPTGFQPPPPPLPRAAAQPPLPPPPPSASQAEFARPSVPPPPPPPSSFQTRFAAAPPLPPPPPPPPQN